MIRWTFLNTTNVWRWGRNKINIEWARMECKTGAAAFILYVSQQKVCSLPLKSETKYWPLQKQKHRDAVTFFFWRDSPQWARASLFARFLDYTQRRTTVGRTPLDVSSARPETSKWQYPTLTTNRHPCPRWDSKPQSQQASGSRPAP